MTFTRFLGLSAVTLLSLLSPIAAAREGGTCTVRPKYSHLGCYVDNENGRALMGPAFQNEGMTVKACRRACSGYEYFGVENAYECFCGDTLIASTADISECNFACGGNATETCGAVNRLNVYKKDGLVLSSAVSSSTFVSSTASPSSSDAVSSIVAPSSSEAISSTLVSSSTPSTTPESSSSELPLPSSSSVEITSSAPPPVSSTSSLPSSTVVPSSTWTTLTTSTTSSTSSSSSSSTTSTTSTTSQCPLTTAFVIPTTGPGCYASIPATCSALNTLVPPNPGNLAARASAAAACHQAFQTQISGTSTALHPAVTPCLSEIVAAASNPQSAYSCLESAATSSIICPQTTSCSPTNPPAPTGTNIIPNGNFNTGSNIFTPWELSTTAAPPSTSNTYLSEATISSGSCRSAPLCLKIAYNNAGPSTREWTQYLTNLIPGATYELSWYWYYNFGQGGCNTYARFTGGGGVSYYIEANGFNTPAGVWHNPKGTFVAGASFGQISFGFTCIRRGGPVSYILDDVALKRLNLL